MSVQQAYNTWAATYNTDTNATRDLDGQITRTLLAGQHYHSILELGVGTGKNTPFFAQIGDRVVSVDFSSEMIKQASAKSYGKTPLFILADLTNDWPCAESSVNLVTCNLILEHIADLDGFFVKAHAALAAGGQFFISELHPFKQYQGKKAVYQHQGEKHEIPAFVHHVSDFVKAGEGAGFTLRHLGEWWDEADRQTPPRLISFLFEKG